MDLKKISKIATDFLEKNQEKIISATSGALVATAVSAFRNHRKDSKPYVNLTDRDAIRLLGGEKLVFRSEFGTFYLSNKRKG